MVGILRILIVVCLTGFGAWNYDKNGRNSIFNALDEFCCADHVLEQRDKNRTILLTAIN